MRALRRASPGHEVVLAAPAALHDLVELSGVAGTLLATDGLEPIRWTGPAPAMAVNLHGRGPQSHLLLRTLRPERLVAFGCEDARHVGPAWDADEHEVRRWCRLLAQSLGIPVDSRDLLLEAPEVAPAAGGAVVIHPGAAFPARRWPTNRFAAVARWARDEGHDVVVTGGPDEVELGEEVCRLAGLPAGAVLAGRTDLVGLAAEVASARLVVCGDTGVAHLATAFGTPSVVLFGPTPPAEWGPPPDRPQHVVLYRGGRGDPHAERPDAGLLAIRVEDVLGMTERRFAA
jgi:ADP-heptose:LPS heptosyltransferase